MPVFVRFTGSAAPLPPTARQDAGLPLMLLLRAVAALLIVWHHFALYPPLSSWAEPLVGEALTWLQQYARSTQIFFVIGGYVMARSLQHHRWSLRGLRAFVIGRYWRLGLPYLAVILLTIPLLDVARGWVPDEVLGQPVSLPQLLAHLFFLQGLLGYEQISAGLWFVCINFQLSLLHALLLWLRDTLGQRRLDIPGLAGWVLSLLSLFHFNLDPGWDNHFIYFFPYFFLGVLIHRHLKSTGPAAALEFPLFLLVLGLALTVEWRWRLGMAAAVAMLLLWAEGRGWTHLPWRLPTLQRLGEISYSLFLVHFPVLIGVATLWSWLDWSIAETAVLGLGTAFMTSLAAAELFHRWVENPAARAGRRRKKAHQPVVETQPTAQSA